MNVFKMDKFECIGSSSVHIPSHAFTSGNPYIDFVIEEPFFTDVLFGDLPIQSHQKYETYQIDKMRMNKIRRKYYGESSYHEVFILRVNPDKQDLSPLDIQPYCQVGWFIG